MIAEEMQKRTDDILAQMDEKGISDKKLRKGVAGESRVRQTV